MGGSSSLKTLKGLKCKQLCNLVDKYKMKPNLKKLKKGFVVQCNCRTYDTKKNS